MLRPFEGGSDAVLEDVELGLEALPEPLRTFPGEPLELELHRAHVAGDDARATAWLRDVPEQERERLWRRRAVVHAVIRRWDERLAWSASPAWRRLSGWNDEGEAFNVYPWAFSRREGMTSPAADLATFAEELLVPAPVAVADEAVRCREPSKSRFLDERLRALDPSWQPRRECPAFDAWARAEHVTRVEVVFAVPSGSMGQATFGHVLLHFVRDDDGDESTGQVVQLAALVSPFEPRSTYLTRGLGGGFFGVYTVTGFGDIEHENLGLEQRALRRFALDLTADQRVRLLERAWELQRTGYITYRFFTANCATMLRYLLEPAMGLKRALTPWEAPTQVLQALAPSLTPVGYDLPTGARARRAEALLSTETRQADVLLARLRIERHRLDQATLERLKTERATLDPEWRGPTTDALVASRQRRFQEHPADEVVAAEAELAEWLALDAQLRAAPRRALSASEEAVVEAERVARERFTAVALQVAELPDAELADARERERAAAQAEVDETLARSVPENGNGMGSVGFGWSTAAGLPVMRARLALLREELGDQRLYGFGSSNEWHLLDATVDLVPRPGAFVSRAEVNGLSVRLLGANGWGWGGGVDHLYALSAHELGGAVEGLRVLAADERLTNFFYVLAAVRGGLRVEPAAVAGFVTPRAGLAARVQLPGSFANCLRFEAAYRPRVRVATSGVSVEHGALGAARATVRLGAPGGFATALRVDAQVEWWQATGVAVTGLIGVEVD
ncbi:MAG: DUF4105 domain-containing protein [Myxococcaceae bacterium]|nr:DUF4105 domain-containing protein [Myxococcaceae bacterium]